MFVLSMPSNVDAQGAKKSTPAISNADADADHEEERSRWFLRGRILPGKSAAELRHRAYRSKMHSRAMGTNASLGVQAESQAASASGGWTPLGPVPLASDGTGQGLQDYHQVSGRATAVAIDATDPSGNTVYIGGAGWGLEIDECGRKHRQ